MRKQRGSDNSEITLPRRAQSRLVQSTGRSSRSGSSNSLHSKLLPPGPPRSIYAVGGGSGTSRNTFCISSSSMGVRRVPVSRLFAVGKGRFGKRPPSFTVDHAVGGPAIDSEDSGFGCDFHSSESQLSWSNDEAKLGGGGVTNSVQQPIFSLSSRSLSNSNLCHISPTSSIRSSSNSSTSPRSFTVPQFSTSSPERQFLTLTSLLQEQEAFLAQEDAIDPYDQVLRTEAQSTSTATTVMSSPPEVSSDVVLSMSDSGISSFPSSISSSLGEFSPESNPIVQQQQQSPNPKPTLILFEAPSTSIASAETRSQQQQQPLDFAQVFGKLSAAGSSTTATPSLVSTVSSGMVNGLLQREGTVTVITVPESIQHQLTCGDGSIIKIDPEMKLPSEIGNENGNKVQTNFQLAFQPFRSIASDMAILTPTTSQPSQHSEILKMAAAAAVEATLKMEVSENSCSNSNHGGSIESVAGSVAVATDPMLILNQAVNLQKELFEEPALDGIPVTGESGTVSGFGFGKAAIPTTTVAATGSTGTRDTLKNLIVESTPSGLVTIVQGQPALGSEQSMKLMQLTDNVRMSPDTADRVTTSTTIPLQVGSIPTTPTMNPMGISTPVSTPVSSSPSPIPMKRTRFSFPHPASKATGLKLRNQNHNQGYMPARSVGKRLPPGTTPTLTSNLSPFARDARVQLQIVSQPEEQHRARYQTEGSRGAIKDRKGNGFPTVKLVGYDKPATLQIFIGTDQGKVSPHMFYQACKVTGKSSTPCIEKKVEGTILIEIEFEPSKENVISCDCVGILKERNVDVEQRFPFHHASQSRKKSTKCRMIFRTTIMNSDGMEETLQVASVPILCTQPPGVPEICKQSLTECPAKGGLELFVIGKNFLKDTRVIFQLEDVEGRILWEASSEPLKDYLQQNHLICVVPPFKEEKIVEPTEVRVMVVSGGKQSEPHRFMYLPELVNAHIGGVPLALSSCLPGSPPQQQQAPPVIPAALVSQISSGQGLMPMDIQTVIPARENELVKTAIVPTLAECSPISSDGSLCSNGSQPSPPVTASALNPLTTIAFPTGASLIQTQVTAGETSPVVTTFLQAAAVQQDTKPAVNLIKVTSNILDSMKAATAATPQFAGLNVALQPEPVKPPVTSAIPLDLQFPTQDLPTTEAAAAMTTAAALTTVTNPFQTVTVPVVPQQQPLSLPQIINGLAMNGTTSPPNVIATVPVTNSPEHSPTTTVANDVVMASRSPTTVVAPVPVQVPVSTLSVVNCLGETIIKTEPTTIGNTIHLPMTNVTTVAQQVPVTGQLTPPTTAAAAAAAVMGLMGELQPHQGPIANALSQLTDSELINYINPTCFDGPM